MAYKFCPGFIANITESETIKDLRGRLLYLQFCEKCYQQLLSSAKDETIGTYQDTLETINPPELRGKLRRAQIESLKKLNLPGMGRVPWSNGDYFTENEARELLEGILKLPTTEMQAEINKWQKSLYQVQIEIDWQEKRLALDTAVDVEFSTVDFPTVDPGTAPAVESAVLRSPRKIEWKGTQSELAHLFKDLEEEGLIGKNTIDTWAATAAECFLVKGKPVKSNALSKVRTDASYKPRHREEIDRAVAKIRKKKS